jgi:hypothetical protein
MSRSESHLWRSVANLHRACRDASAYFSTFSLGNLLLQFACKHLDGPAARLLRAGRMGARFRSVRSRAWLQSESDGAQRGVCVVAATTSPARSPPHHGRGSIAAPGCPSCLSAEGADRTAAGNEAKGGRLAAPSGSMRRLIPTLSASARSLGRDPPHRRHARSASTS